MMASATLDNIIGHFQEFTQKPVNFLTVQEDVKEDIKNLVKSLYDFTKVEETKKVKKKALPELIVEDFDEEQIWQEIELQNSECWDQFVWDVANCLSTKNELKFPVETVAEAEKSEPELEEEDMSEEESIPSENEQELPAKAGKKQKVSLPIKLKPSVVDDKFFKLQEMEQFLLSEEKAGGSKGKDSDDESIDLFEDDDDSDDETGEKDVMYSDFFEGNDQEYVQDDGDFNDDDENSDQEMDEQPQKTNVKKVRFTDAKSSEDDDDDKASPNIPNNNNITSKDIKKSEFELRQQRLQQQISRLEEKTLADAPWQLKGEVDGTKRPQNSLLQEVVDFDLTTRPPPIITEQTTITLEQIIKQRVKDKAWDDVVRKEKPVDDQLAFRKTEIIDQSKSKQSLAQVYEAEYLKQKKALSGEVEDEQEPESHKEIRESMSKLFSKLDALCNYHYTPKAAQAEVKIVSNTPAISMEEVAPVATSDAALLAPEEVKKKHRGDLMSKEERSKTDRNRERRKKKKLQQKKGKVEKVTEHRNTKKTVEASDKSLKTSRAFFQQLNSAK